MNDFKHAMIEDEIEAAILWMEQTGKVVLRCSVDANNNCQRRTNKDVSLYLYGCLHVLLSIISQSQYSISSSLHNTEVCCRRLHYSTAMSGIEVGGIALAVFPILVDALVHFVDGVQTIKDWRRYRVRLDNYANLMETHKVFYLDTLEELLTDIVQFEDEITDLMANPRGAIWKKPEYEEKLRQRLGRSYNAYIQTLDKMRNALSEMCDKLGVDSSGKVGAQFRYHYRCRWRLNVRLSIGALG